MSEYVNEIIVCKHVKYISNEFNNLTVGKNYTVVAQNDTLFKLTDDSGECCWYPQNNFYSLREYRDYKLRKLGL